MRRRRWRGSTVGTGIFSILSSCGQADLAHQVETQQDEEDHPDTDENFTVEEFPVPDQVGIGEEFHTECELEETEDNLYRVEPAAG